MVSSLTPFPSPFPIYYKSKLKLFYHKPPSKYALRFVDFFERVINIVLVSIQEPKLFSPNPSTALKHSSGRPIRILCLDVGLKYNQLRCFLKRGVEVSSLPKTHPMTFAILRNIE